MVESTSSYKRLIISVCLVIGIIILAFSLVYSVINGSFQNFWKEFTNIISPIVIGFIIAYFSNKIVMIFEKKLFHKIKKFNIRRLLSIVVVFILIAIVIVFLLTMLIPNIMATVRSFWETYVINYESALKILANRVNATMDKFAFLDSVQRIDPNQLVETIHTSFPWIDKLVEGDFSSIIPDNVGPSGSSDTSSGFDISLLLKSDSFLALFSYALSFGSSLFNIVKNLVLGIFVAIYMLMCKEKFAASLRRFLNGILAPRTVRYIVRFGKLLDRSFGGFIEGQLLDAFIVGIGTFFIFLFFDFSNPHLLATIIAVTNVIPILGPFLGGIPAAFLVLITQPEKTVLFIILIFVVQQIDGNIICPNILSDKINISSLATLIAIVIMGGMFGIFGMFIGVPVFAVVIHLINNYTINALRRKGFETGLQHYYVGNVEDVLETNSKNKDIKILKRISSVVKKFFMKKPKQRKNKTNKEN